MKKTIITCVLVIFATSAIILSCKKETPAPVTNTPTNPYGAGNSVITNTYNINLSAANKNFDSVSVDVDNDNLKDFTILTYNSTFDSYQEPRIIKASYIYSWQDSTKIALINRYANYGNWARQYNFGSNSQYFLYVAGFNSGSVIGAGISNTGNSSATTAFESVGHSWDCTSSYVYENNTPFVYNESMGDFLNTIQYIGFTIWKTDGRHYGWIKISNLNSCLNLAIISSSFSNYPNQSISIN